jgi:hypothetical protein
VSLIIKHTRSLIPREQPLDYRIFGAEVIEEAARKQMNDVMRLSPVVGGALMPDAPESNITLFLEKALLSVGDVTERTKISMFVKNMPAQDSRALRKFIRDNEPNIDMTNDMTCASCGEASKVDMPIGSSFLWPDS